ncbi:unnamed protein product [Dovyalis caffra]|uniref:Folate receptor-like domain-containing protein n=1 Tax=Dovyalis caffra TaxID=77055 RepID=A0AAV1RWD5_9ROSI|nr:unnamed protein product [Dovyalis caffra]
MGLNIETIYSNYTGAFNYPSLWIHAEFNFLTRGQFNPQDPNSYQPVNSKLEKSKMKRISYGFLILLFLFHLQIHFSSGKNAGVCISKGGRFPPYSSEGKPPRKVGKGAKDLTLCRLFRKKTCCDVAQTYPASMSVRRLASTGEATQECLQLWELLECSICDPQIGVQPGPPLICASFCDRVYQACANAYFSMDANKRVVAPCGVNDFVCGHAAEMVSNGTELCHAAGFAVKLSDDAYVGAEEASCYGGIASLDSISDSWRSPRSEFPQKAENLGVLEDFQQWVQEMPFSEKVSWAVGGLVLTAGLLFMSKRKSHSQRQKLAAIQRTARRLDGKMSPNSPGSLVNRKGNRR